MQQHWNVLPEKFLEKLDDFVPQDKKQSVLESFLQRKPSTFRANTLKITADELEKELKLLAIETERVPWYKDAFILKNVPQKVLAETKFYKEGYLYVQSLSSMIPPLILDPQPNEIILDMTAAPGSKTTQIAAYMKNTGTLIANDKSRIRNFRLSANLQMQGVTNAQVLSLPGEFLWKKYPEYFDRVLVDVPCSMEGRFFIEDPKTYQDWTPGKVKQLSEMQKWLIRSAVSATRVGGTIIYSTCTLSPEENEEVINWILKKEKGAVELDEIIIKDLPTDKGLTQYKNKIFDTSLSKTVRIYPTKDMEGFFIAKLRKVSPNILY
ncbi:MAG TPA: RsmB/NOP family class I SAM-dependent RNA methyltransferase [Candidatus Eisenbacteria bacterium]|nr:RsmB/NOP family class I SAM-dependent RNA methyltransferase [Candidatus Eisenbacteria bacterium]